MMIKTMLSITVRTTFSIITACFFCSRLEAATSLTTPTPAAEGEINFQIQGASNGEVTLQGSSDMKSWKDLQVYPISIGPISVRRAAVDRHQYFRLRESSSPPVPPVSTLTELSTLPNAVFMAGEGVDTVQFAPNGTVGYIFWNGRNLTFRERTSSSWIEQTISSGGNLIQLNSAWTDYRFQRPALFFYDANSQPHVFLAKGGTSIAHFVRAGASWSEAELINASAANGDVSQLVGAIGANNSFHLAVVSGGGSPNLSYGSNRSGQWTWNNVSSVAPFPTHYWAPSYAPRWLSMAVDSSNSAHIVFRPEYRISHSGGYVRAYNELAYASNRGGQWSVQIVQKPQDISGEAGNGLSVAIGPDDKPYIAAWYNERGEGGSSQASQLNFYSRDGSGNWVKQKVISRPEGYIAGDGEKGTGFAPYLRFDSRGRPHIVFLDHAAEHFSESGQSEYAGHIRHAVLNNGAWEVETLFRQTDPMRNQMIYPAFAMNGNEIVVTGLERATTWNMAYYPPSLTSTYRFRVLAAPLK